MHYTSRIGYQDFLFMGTETTTRKTTLLQATYPDALWVDLLKADEFRRYVQNPELLRGELAVRSASKISAPRSPDVSSNPNLAARRRHPHSPCNRILSTLGGSILTQRRTGIEPCGTQSIGFDETLERRPGSNRRRPAWEALSTGCNPYLHYPKPSHIGHLPQDPTTHLPAVPRIFRVFDPEFCPHPVRSPYHIAFL
jgi:hypothetical protein